MSVILAKTTKRNTRRRKDVTHERIVEAAGRAIRRSGYARWLRNIAIALGNAPTTPEVIAALRSRADSENPVVHEHVAWALARHGVA